MQHKKAKLIAFCRRTILWLTLLYYSPVDNQELLYHVNGWGWIYGSQSCQGAEQSMSILGFGLLKLSIIFGNNIIDQHIIHNTIIVVIVHLITLISI